MALFPIAIIINNEEDEEDYNRNLRLTRRHLRENSDPFTLPDQRFIELFRLNKNCVRYLIDILRNHFPASQKSFAIYLEIKLFATLRYYATGSYQRSVGQDYLFGLSQTSVSKAIAEITEALAETVVPQWIVFPQTEQEIFNIQEGFMQNGFPGCIGAIDGTHVSILKPKTNCHLYLNRKGFYSINVQIICDSRLRILSVNARYPGSTHDSFIWRSSNIKAHLQHKYNEGNQYWLIGDSGYPVLPYLMTPILGAVENTPEGQYNTAHILARNCVERCIGVLKNRFRCILKENMSMYDPTKVGVITTVCAALHNMTINEGIEIDIININDDNAMPPDGRVNNDVADRNEGQNIRQNIINQYFT